MKGTDIRCLWGTANMFSNPRYMNGAGSSNSADVFCFAAAQIKKALELTAKLGGKGYVDAFALGLIKAAELIEDGRIDRFISERYSSYNNGIGERIRNGQTTLNECAAYAEKLGKPAMPGSGRQEYLQSILNGILFG